MAPKPNHESSGDRSCDDCKHDIRLQTDREGDLVVVMERERAWPGRDVVRSEVGETLLRHCELYSPASSIAPPAALQDLLKLITYRRPLVPIRVVQDVSHLLLLFVKETLHAQFSPVTGLSK